MGFMQRQGYRVIPVNPVLAQKNPATQIHGETVYASLSAIPIDIREKVNMVEVFRKSNAVAGIADEILELKGAKAMAPEFVWMQLGVVNEGAAQRLRAAGVEVVMDACPKIEVPRLRIAPLKSRL
jgi:predicted CoA-binding protein